MTADWQDRTWGEIATLEYGKSLKNYVGSSGKIPVFGTNGQIGWHTEALYEEPSVIVGRKGAYRGIHYSATPFFVIDTAFYLKPKINLDTKWAYYELLTHDINAMDSGSAIPSTSRDEFYSLDVLVPPLPEQHSIAHILGTLDDKIKNNRKTVKTLEAMAQAIFKSWFVDFDPVRAKMNGESKESICKRLKLTPEILDLFPDKLVDSELGEIPEGWEVGTFGDLADIVGGSTPSTKTSDYWNQGTHNWATPKDLSNLMLPVLLNTENKITDAGLEQISSGLLPIGTVLLSSRAPIGYLAITEIPVAINQGFIALKPHNPENSSFIMLLVKHNMDEIISRANGSTFLEISKAKFRPIPVILPTGNILKYFSGLIIPLISKVVSLEKIALKQAIIRDTLLPKLISGETRVPEAEHLIENIEG